MPAWSTEPIQKISTCQLVQVYGDLRYKAGVYTLFLYSYLCHRVLAPLTLIVVENNNTCVAKIHTHALLLLKRDLNISHYLVDGRSSKLLPAILLTMTFWAFGSLLDQRRPYHNNIFTAISKIVQTILTSHKNISTDHICFMSLFAKIWVRQPHKNKISNF